MTGLSEVIRGVKDSAKVDKVDPRAGIAEEVRSVLDGYLRDFIDEEEVLVIVGNFVEQVMWKAEEGDMTVKADLFNAPKTIRDLLAHLVTPSDLEKVIVYTDIALQAATLSLILPAQKTGVSYRGALNRLGLAFE
jgi:hypothetical protein